MLKSLESDSYLMRFKFEIGTSCYPLVTSLMTVTDLLQVVPTRLIQAIRNKLLRACCHQLVTCRRYQTCWNNLLRVCWPHQPCYKMITTCSRLVIKWEPAVRTNLVDKLWVFHACRCTTSTKYNFATFIKFLENVTFAVTMWARFLIWARGASWLRRVQ
jgi:hypothetical protein